MAARLPDDLLHLVCASLSQQKDFHSLFQCACSGKQLAVPALAALYRMHHKAPITSKTMNDSVTGEEKITVTAKWANMWHSIILSCLDKALFSYAQYVRKLDFHDLESLLDEAMFWGRISNEFFGGEMGQLKVESSIKLPAQPRRARTIRPNKGLTVNKIAELVTHHTPMLERVQGNETLDGDIIKRFLPYTPHMRHLRVYEGRMLHDAGDILRNHCPQFTKIGCYGWQQSSADLSCAGLLEQLRPQSLRSFSIYSRADLGAQSFQALNCHCESLSKLELHSLDANAVQNLSKFKNCTNLTYLVLAEISPPTVDLVKRHNDVFVELVEWLQSCKCLRKIEIQNFLSATALLTPLLKEPGIELESLTLESYSMSESREFHQALALQSRLRTLRLKGEDSETISDNDILVESLKQLHNLVDLKMAQVSANFTEHHISILAKNLTKLETLFTGGFHITDDILLDLAKLKHLTRLELNADSRFTADGLMDFILSLGSGNRGLQLSIMMQDTDCDIPEREQSIIRETLSSHLGGKFDFLLVRGLEEEGAFSSEDSD